MIEPYKELRNSSRALRSLRDNLLKRAAMSRASPAWRRMASSRVSVAPSCINRGRKRTPQSGAVRTLFAAPWNLSTPSFDSTQFKVRTAPLWGVRLRTRLMHDGATLTLLDAVRRHAGEARNVTARFNRLCRSDRNALLEFLRSL